jgi:hypothetical protein
MTPLTVRLWPSTTPSGGVLAPSTNTLFGNEFEVSAQQGVYNVWWYSASGALTLPTACGVWNLDTQENVCENLSPSWSGAAGSGWVSCSFPGSDAVNSGTHYGVAIFGGSGSNWRYHTPSYWTTGAGASGISNGVLSAPSNASALLGQSIGGGTGSWSCPTSGAAGQNYWVDVEVGALAGTTGIYEDASTPAVVTGSAVTELTTAEFSPPANVLLVAIAAWGNNDMSSPSLAVTDSLSGEWTAGPSLYYGSYEMAAIFYKYQSSAETDMTVTCTGTGFLQASPAFAVRVLANAASNQSSAAMQTADGDSDAVSAVITTTAAGSWVYVGASGFPIGTSATANDNTTTIESFYPAETDVLDLIGCQTDATGTPGATSLGWVSAGAGVWCWVAQEILPAPSTLPATIGLAQADAEVACAQQSAGVSTAQDAASVSPAQAAAAVATAQLAAGVATSQVINGSVTLEQAI